MHINMVPTPQPKGVRTMALACGLSYAERTLKGWETRRRNINEKNYREGLHTALVSTEEQASLSKWDPIIDWADLEDAARDMLDQKEPYSKIAWKLGVGRNAFIAWLREQGVPPTPETPFAIPDGYDPIGKTAQQVAADLGFSANSYLKYRKKRGLPVNKRKTLFSLPEGYIIDPKKTHKQIAMELGVEENTYLAYRKRNGLTVARWTREQA